ncbi:MAG: hypothetical protein ABSF83_00405 [Nitrososphaerales archaeon]
MASLQQVSSQTLFVYVVGRQGEGEEFEIGRSDDYGVGEGFIENIDYVAIPVVCRRCGALQIVYDEDIEVDGTTTTTTAISPATVQDGGQTGPAVSSHAGGDYDCSGCDGSFHVEVGIDYRAMCAAFGGLKTQDCDVVRIYGLENLVEDIARPMDEEDQLPLDPPS